MLYRGERTQRMLAKSRSCRQSRRGSLQARWIKISSGKRALALLIHLKRRYWLPVLHRTPSSMRSWRRPAARRKGRICSPRHRGTMPCTRSPGNKNASSLNFWPAGSTRDATSPVDPMVLPLTASRRTCRRLRFWRSPASRLSE